MNVPSDVDRFVSFIDTKLAPKGVNLLVLRINYNYQWESQPQLARGLSHDDALKIKQVCKQNNIEVVPAIDCLGHQSWKKNYGPLLEVYPQFEENPGNKINASNFYCRSYCPNHPELHTVLFGMFDELIDVFEPKAFHIGMDEVFIIGEESCKNGCAGQDKAKLFANEANRLHNFLQEKGVETWIWGDRLIDGNATGLGMWQASENGIHDAIKYISKDIVICDWHYKDHKQTATKFAEEGFSVISCSHQVDSIALLQLEEMQESRLKNPNNDKMMGVMQTVWFNSSSLMDAFDGKEVEERGQEIHKTFEALSTNW